MLFYLAHGCPNCGGIISDERLSKGLPCEKCLKVEIPLEKDLTLNKLGEILQRENKLKELKPFIFVESQISVFQEVFYELFYTKPSSLQLSWAKRFYLGESFA
ncbi:MAG: hypothetical protein ACK4GE_03705, partial [Caldimicrobium sp.]